jgi:hypothetical protein
LHLLCVYGVPLIGVYSEMSLVRPQSEHVRTTFGRSVHRRPAAVHVTVDIVQAHANQARQTAYNAQHRRGFGQRSPASDQPVQDVLAATRSSQRQPFVGRESELRQLQSAFESAAKGDGALSVLVAEPGIGQRSLACLVGAEVRTSP